MDGNQFLSLAESPRNKIQLILPSKGARTTALLFGALMAMIFGSMGISEMVIQNL